MRTVAKTCRVALAITLALPGVVATALGESTDDVFGAYQTASNETLGKLRGGFVGQAGGQRLDLAFGIEQAVMVNDQLVVATRLVVPNINRIADAHVERFIAGNVPDAVTSAVPVIAAQAPAAAATEAVTIQHTGSPVAPVQVTSVRASQVSVRTIEHPTGQLSLVQIGPGNTFTLNSSQLPAGALSIIQNTLNNQTVRQTTTVEIGANSLSLLRSMHFASMLQQQIAGSLK